VEEYVFRIPAFTHDFGTPEPHNYKGSLVRHIVVEELLYKARAWLNASDAMPGYKLFNAFIVLLFGLNCNFPRKDISLFVAGLFTDLGITMHLKTRVTLEEGPVNE